MRALILGAALLLTGGCATHQHVGDCPTCLGTSLYLSERAKEQATQEGAKAAVDFINKQFEQAARQRQAQTAPVTSE